MCPPDPPTAPPRLRRATAQKNTDESINLLAEGEGAGGVSRSEYHAGHAMLSILHTSATPTAAGRLVLSKTS
eukprot:scaffold396_cov127-Isochrysis_galbana.AAC.7